MKHIINYHKMKLIDLGDLNTSAPSDCNLLNNPYKIAKIQQYNPIFSLFFSLDDSNYNKISLNHINHIQNLHQMINMNTDEIKNTDFFLNSRLC